MKQSIRIGTSGWIYPHWNNLFFPEEVPKTHWLEYYSTVFSTVEVNATFYHSPQPKTFENWKARTPEGFLWAVKANRYITHLKRLHNVEEPLARFCSLVEILGKKLGPILFQLPPSLVYNEEAFDYFCSLLEKKYRYAVEPRNASWMEEPALARLKQHGIAFCISETAGRFPYREAVTADFVYIRLHGSQRLYASDYTEEELQAWAKKIRKWKKDTYVYFDNDANAYAPKNALRLKEILKAPPP